MRPRLAMVSVMTAAVVAFVSAQTNQLVGTVRDVSGHVLPGVTVTLDGPALEKAQRIVTDAKGTFTFKNVPADDGYVVTFALVAFRTVVGHVTVTEGKDATADAVMRIAAPATSVPDAGNGIVLLSVP